MADSDQWLVAGLDAGGTTINATLLDAEGRFLVEEMAESPSCVREGPDKAIDALEQALADVLELTGTSRAAVRMVGLDTPGPVTAKASFAPRAPPTSLTLNGVVSTCAGPWSSESESPWCSTTTRTPPRCMHITSISGREGLSCDPQCPSSSEPGSAEASSRPGRSSGAQPGWLASSGTSGCRWRACWHPASRFRCATAGCRAMPRASPP